MYKICIFAGTTEGRKLAELLAGEPVSLTVCVATEYGGELLGAAENISVLAKRLDREQMAELIKSEKYDLVIDATHPYAVDASENISAACADAGAEKIRLLREESSGDADVIRVPDANAAAEYLSGTDGNILLTTGSKALSVYSRISGFSERVYARVLPVEASLEACRAAGVKTSNIIAMQGAFSEEMNLAHLKFANAKYMVTKDGGEAGGFEEKVSAAERAGVKLIVIGRPPEDGAVSFNEAVELLMGKFNFALKPRVVIAGIGPGEERSMTGAVRQAIAGADLLIGAKRMLDVPQAESKRKIFAVDLYEIAEAIKESRCRNVAVLMSGDTGFFSGTKRLLPLLDGYEVELLPGISSMAYLCAKLKKSYENIKPISAHGRECNIAMEVRLNAEVFVLTGGENRVENLLERLENSGIGDVKVYIGERLGYPDERITVGTPSKLAGDSFDALSAMIIENRGACKITTHGIDDKLFCRVINEREVIPMTKCEIRSICLSKLKLTEDSVCWDVGAGSGSVAIEMALKAHAGKVWAIEKKDSAAELIEENKKRFFAENIAVVQGIAPQALEALPAPTHVFIGGSSGNMREIIRCALKKNEKVRIVATAVLIETVAELSSCMKEFEEHEVVCVSVAKGKDCAGHSMMVGQNPVYVFTMQNGGAEQ